MIRASIQRALLKAMSAQGKLSVSDVKVSNLVATNVHLDSGSLLTGTIRAFTNSTAFQELVNLAVAKAIADSAGSSDLYAAHLFKNVSEVVSMGTVSDIATKDVGKGLIEAPSIAEVLAYGFDKQLADTGALTDVPAKAFSRPVSDTFTSSDAHVTAFGKNPSEAPAISDAQVFVVDKSLTDTAGMSDVLVRAMVYSRSFSDSVTVSDALSTGIEEGLDRSPQNTAGVTDVAALGYSKPVSENPTATDAHFYTFSKTLSEAPSIAEQVGKAPSLVKADGADAADSPLLLLEKNFGTGLQTGNTAEISESTVFALSLVRTETPSVADVFAKSISKVIADTADISDAFALVEDNILSPSNTANASDSAAISVGASKSNTFDAADAYAAAFSKNLEDPANSSDTGVLLAQGYVSSTDYFSDDFVGVKRTLT
jgi:hypothetical protein